MWPRERASAPLGSTARCSLVGERPRARTGASTMHTFTAVVPTQALLPAELALLLAPVRVNEPSDPDEYVGRTDGVLLDRDGRVVAFILQLTRKLGARGARTLVPVTAMTLTEGSV